MADDAEAHLSWHAALDVAPGAKPADELPGRRRTEGAVAHGNEVAPVGEPEPLVPVARQLAAGVDRRRPTRAFVRRKADCRPPVMAVVAHEHRKFAAVGRTQHKRLAEIASRSARDDAPVAPGKATVRRNGHPDRLFSAGRFAHLPKDRRASVLQPHQSCGRHHRGKLRKYAGLSPGTPLVLANHDGKGLGDTLVVARPFS